MRLKNLILLLPAAAARSEHLRLRETDATYRNVAYFGNWYASFALTVEIQPPLIEGLGRYMEALCLKIFL